MVDRPVECMNHPIDCATLVFPVTGARSRPRRSVLLNSSDVSKQTTADGGLLASSPSPACRRVVRFKPPPRPKIRYMWRTSPIRVVYNILVFITFPEWFFMKAFSLSYRASVLKSQ
jgi:hypothetical protein